jgi:hypothetical protein
MSLASEIPLFALLLCFKLSPEAYHHTATVIVRLRRSDEAAVDQQLYTLFPRKAMTILGRRFGHGEVVLAIDVVVEVLPYPIVPSKTCLPVRVLPQPSVGWESTQGAIRCQ